MAKDTPVIEFAPLSIPLERRLQTAAAIFFTTCFFMFGALTLTSSWYILLYSEYRFIVLLYGIWYICDINTCNRGGRRVPWIRTLRVWRYLSDYFPVKLVKTAELNPDLNYIFGYHPHGIVAAGAFCNFATESTGFTEKFKGIVPHLLTLEGQFYFPIHREFLLLTGSCAVTKESINHILNYKGKGNAAVIVIGGAVEALDAIPGSYKLKLNSRKGFVRMALQNGAQLVPVFTFGENDLYSQNGQSGFVKRLQERLTKIFGFSMPMFHGRGVFNYTFGPLPYRKPLTTVVGAPIQVRRNPDPTYEEVNTLHKEYMRQLKILFDTHKAKYGSADSELTIA